MRKPTRTQIDVRKASYFAVATNTIELILVLVVAGWMLHAV